MPCDDIEKLNMRLDSLEHLIHIISDKLVDSYYKISSLENTIDMMTAVKENSCNCKKDISEKIDTDKPNSDTVVDPKVSSVYCFRYVM